jgi:hypothetical protein|tara:strand:+ start:3932 stop:4066 length:135 start_codon:yes stop_codon:yes gene_type:complete
MGCGCKGKKNNAKLTPTSKADQKEEKEKRMRLIKERLIKIANPK